MEVERQYFLFIPSTIVDHQTDSDNCDKCAAKYHAWTEKVFTDLRVPFTNSTLRASLLPPSNGLIVMLQPFRLNTIGVLFSFM